MKQSQASLLLSSISYISSTSPIMNKGHPARFLTPCASAMVDSKKSFQTFEYHLDQSMTSPRTFCKSSTSIDMETPVREPKRTLLIPSIREEDYYLPSQNISSLSSIQEDYGELEYKLNKTPLQRYINLPLSPRISPAINFSTKKALLIPSKSQNQLERCTTVQSKRQDPQSETHRFYQRSNRKGATQITKTNLNFTIIWPEKTEESQPKNNFRIHKSTKGDSQKSRVLVSSKGKVTPTNESRIASPKIVMLKLQKTKKTRGL